MADLVINVEVSGLKEASDTLSKIQGGLLAARRRASTRAAKHGKTVMSSRIRQEVAIAKKDVDPTIKTIRVGAADAAVVVKKTARISLKAYDAKMLKGGNLTYRIMTAGKRQSIRGPFIIAAYGGHVYRRRGRERGPLVKLYGVSPWGVAFGKKGVQRDVKTAMAKMYRKRIIHEVDRLIRKSGGG